MSFEFRWIKLLVLLATVILKYKTLELTTNKGRPSLCVLQKKDSMLTFRQFCRWHQLTRRLWLNCLCLERIELQFEILTFEECPRTHLAMRQSFFFWFINFKKYKNYTNKISAILFPIRSNTKLVPSPPKHQIFSRLTVARIILSDEK